MAVDDLLGQTAVHGQLIDQGDQGDQLLVQVVRRRLAGDVQCIQVAAEYGEQGALVETVRELVDPGEQTEHERQAVALVRLSIRQTVHRFQVDELLRLRDDEERDQIMLVQRGLAEIIVDLDEKRLVD